MNEETPSLVTHSPCQAPIATPASTASSTARPAFISYFTVRTASTTPTRATAEPTERSKLRVTISITALTAARLTIEVCSASSTRLRWLRKVPWVAKLRATQTTATTTSRVDSRSELRFISNPRGHAQQALLG